MAHRRRPRNLEVAFDVDVRDIRQNLGLTQIDFAQRYGFTLASVRNWEQGLRRPDRSARLLLKLISEETSTVDRLLDRLGA